MKLNNLQSLIKEELKKALKEEYKDKFKMVGTLITDLDIRPQKEIYSDIRALPGVTVISSVEPISYAEQDKNKFKAILTVKVDGYPWITKGGFGREKMEDIASNIRKVPGVKSFFTKPEEITSI
jgi:hypothetical protein